MELKKESVRFSKNQGRYTGQITLEKDFNIPDNKEDAKEIVQSRAGAEIEGVKLAEDTAGITGNLSVEILYKCQKDGAFYENLEGTIGFSDDIAIQSSGKNDCVNTSYFVEDLKVKLLNSRKLTVNVLLSVTVELYDIEEAEMPCLPEKNPSADFEVDCAGETLEFLALAVRKKDTLRVKEDVWLGQNKPNISKLLWKEIAVNGINIKVDEGKLKVSGEVTAFFLYQGEEEHIPLQWLEKSISFNEEIECPQAAFGQIPDISLTPGKTEVSVKPDYDGENRVIAVDLMFDIGIWLYEEQKKTILADTYSPDKELIITRNDVKLPGLIMKNNAKCRVAQKVSLPEDAACMQICAGNAGVNVDSVTVDQDILVEGTLFVTIIYMSSDDENPVKSFSKMLPFSESVEAKGAKPKSQVIIRPGMEQLSTVMLSGNELEVRAVISLDALAYDETDKSIISQIEQRDFDEEVLSAMPPVIGYVVKEGDTLWSIAKEFFTSIERIKKYNNLTGDVVARGDKLLIVKEGQL